MFFRPAVTVSRARVGVQFCRHMSCESWKNFRAAVKGSETTMGHSRRVVEAVREERAKVQASVPSEITDVVSSLRVQHRHIERVDDVSRPFESTFFDSDCTIPGVVVRCMIKRHQAEFLFLPGVRPEGMETMSNKDVVEFLLDPSQPLRRGSFFPRFHPNITPTLAVSNADHEHQDIHENVELFYKLCFGADYDGMVDLVKDEASREKKNKLLRFERSSRIMIDKGELIISNCYSQDLDRMEAWHRGRMDLSVDTKMPVEALVEMGFPKERIKLHELKF
jgi:hypothetical protein